MLVRKKLSSFARRLVPFQSIAGFCGAQQYEKLKKVLVIHADLSIADGTLTPSMKLRRRPLEERYRKEIDALYASAQAHSRAASTSGATP